MAFAMQLHRNDRIYILITDYRLKSCVIGIWNALARTSCQYRLNDVILSLGFVVTWNQNCLMFKYICMLSRTIKRILNNECSSRKTLKHVTVHFEHSKDISLEDGLVSKFLKMFVCSLLIGNENHLIGCILSMSMIFSLSGWCQSE